VLRFRENGCLKTTGLLIKYGIMNKYEKISLQHITSVHVEMVCANLKKGCPFCKNPTFPHENLPGEGDSIAITGRLIIDKGWDYENLVKGKYSIDKGKCYCDYYRPEFEIHPVYTIEPYIVGKKKK
jgi:hypothetical protein